MKNIFNLIAVTLLLVVASACEEGFDKLNQSKTGATSVDPIMTFNDAVIFCSPQGGVLQYEMAAVQQLITSNSGVQVGANFNQVNVGATPAAWTNFYQNVIKYSADAIVKTKSDPARKNLYNMARIIQQYGFMVLTDTYGDIPYTEAGKAYPDAVFFPKYDTQKDIYNGIITELTAAIAALDPAATVETSDVLYAGNITKWKRFGSSLLLRAGMRLINKDATKAAATVVAAINGSTANLILTNADNAIIRHDANFVNNVGNALNGTEAANFYLAKPFVDALKANNDPRLPAIGVRVAGAKSGPDQVATNAIKDSSIGNQYGMPMGSTDATANAAGATLPPGPNGAGNLFSFTQADRARVTSRSSPMFLVTAAETNLLLAEAVERGFITGVSATYFDAGIKAHMDQMASYAAGSAITASARDNYATNRDATFAAAGTSAQRIAEINYEYWVASFLNGNETWANFRRVGMETMTYLLGTAPGTPTTLFVSNPYSGKTVDWVNRITYPPSESLVNTANYSTAVSSMGGTDGLGVKVYWAK
jgi:hypothetical protein